MTENNCEFENCKNMIVGLVGKVYNRYRRVRPDIQYEDVLSEGYLLYSWCLANYKKDKACKFTTYLYMNLLQRLKDYYKCTMKPLSHYEDNDQGWTRINTTPRRHDSNNEFKTSYEDNLESINYQLNNDDLIFEAKRCLSYEANKVFLYIIGKEWENEHNRVKPKITQIRKRFGYDEELIKQIMLEIGEFWNKVGYAVA